MESVNLGSGLNNMRQPVQQLNGTLDIMSQHRHGTTLTFRIPRPDALATRQVIVEQRAWTARAKAQ